MSLAIAAINEGRYLSVRKAASDYDVSITTLRNRLKGVTCRAQKRANCHKFTQNEEDQIVQRALMSVQHGTIPPRSHIRQIANALLSERGTTPAQTVGQNWVTNFIKRRAELQVLYPQRISRRYIDRPSDGGEATAMEELHGGVRTGSQPGNHPMRGTLQRLTKIEKHIAAIREQLEMQPHSASSPTRLEPFIKGIEAMMGVYVDLMKEAGDPQASVPGNEESVLFELGT